MERYIYYINLRGKKTTPHHPYVEQAGWLSNEQVRRFMSFESSKLIGAGLATISICGTGVGIGIIFNGLILGFSRNPEL
jgi:hypothetical protein